LRSGIRNAAGGFELKDAPLWISINLVLADKNDVGKGLNFRSRAMVAVRISPQLKLLCLGTALGFEGLQSGLEWELVLGNQQTDHLTQLPSSRKPVAYYQFLHAWFHGVTSRKIASALLREQRSPQGLR